MTTLYNAEIAGAVLLSAVIVISLVKDIPARKWKQMILTLSVCIPLLVYMVYLLVTAL